jgi:L-malate glycosyltransferase
VKIGISCYPTVGGSGAVATELGKALAHAGHQVHFIVTDVPFRLGEFHENIFVHQTDTVSYAVLRTPPYDFSLSALMARVIAEYDLDILHVHYALPFAVCAFLAKEMLGNHPVRIVTTLHGTDVTVLAQDKSLKQVMKLGIERSDAVTAVSHSLAGETQELFQTSKPISCIYNFVDPEVFRPLPKGTVRHCFAGPGEKVLLHISNFRKVKRISDVILVFERVQEQIPAKLVLIGEGPELSPARELVKALHLENKVMFFGKQDEVAPLFAAADVFLLPSAKESFGLVALEAMACGVPVVGSIIGGIPEVVIHGKTGFLSPVGDIEDMARNVLSLLQDDEQYERMSIAARVRSKENFSIKDRVGDYELLYRKLIKVRAL